MHEVERLAALVPRRVRGLETGKHVEDEPEDDRLRDRLTGRGREVGELREGDAGRVLHDEEQLLAVRDDVEHWHDVRMPDAAREARLVGEHCREGRVHRAARVEALDRDDAREARRAEDAAEVDLGHPAAADRVEEGIATDDDRSAGESRALVRSRAHFTIRPTLT